MKPITLAALVRWGEEFARTHTPAWTPADIDTVLASDAWRRTPRCEECGLDDGKTARMVIGRPSVAMSVCVGCLRTALRMLEEENS